MIGKLKKVSTRTLRNKKVTRLRIDIPHKTVQDKDIDDEDAIKWLANNVDSEVGVSIGPLGDDEQEVLDSEK